MTLAATKAEIRRSTQVMITEHSMEFYRDVTRVPVQCYNTDGRLILQ